MFRKVELWINKVSQLNVVLQIKIKPLKAVLPIFKNNIARSKIKSPHKLRAYKMLVQYDVLHDWLPTIIAGLFLPRANCGGL